MADKTHDQRFEGTSSYIATDDLKVAVNAAVTLRRPLLVKGEPGTGKTVLAHEISDAMASSVMSAFMRLPITSRRANCGRHSPPSSCPFC